MEGTGPVTLEGPPDADADLLLDVGVNNLGDKQPPFLYANNTLNANTDPSDFDLMGRYYWGRVTVKF